MNTYDGFSRRALFGWALQVAQSAHDGATQEVMKPAGARHDQVRQPGARCPANLRHGSVRLHRQREHESRLRADRAASAMLAVTSGYFLSDLDALHARLFRRRQAN